jgi:hypothetical protein
MQKTIIAGFAVLLLSAGVTAAQTNMSGQSDASATAAPKMKAQATAHYPKAEAKLNAEEAQVTKQLNTQESQEVASNSGTSGGDMSASASASSSGSAPQ